MLSSKLLAVIRTKEDVNRLALELRELEAGLYKTGDGEFEKVLSSKVRKGIAEIITSEMLDSKIDKKLWLREIEKEIEGLKVIRITLALEFPQMYLDRITNWIAQNIGEGVVVDIEVRSEIVGGAMVSSGGKFGDYSFQKKLDNVWQTNGAQMWSEVCNG